MTMSLIDQIEAANQPTLTAPVQKHPLLPVKPKGQHGGKRRFYAPLMEKAKREVLHVLAGTLLPLSCKDIGGYTAPDVPLQRIKKALPALLKVGLVTFKGVHKRKWAITEKGVRHLDNT